MSADAVFDDILLILDDLHEMGVAPEAVDRIRRVIARGGFS